MSYNMWVKSSVTPLMSVYVFNYTNAAEIEKGSKKKLKVEEVGPYVYR
jgi:dihydroorotase